MVLHIDIETYSSIDIGTAGVYKYVESIDFEIMLVAYAFDNGPVRLVDLTSCQDLPDELHEALINPEIEKWAHNATFERLAFKQFGYDIPVKEWFCTMVKAAYCGLPLALEQVSKAMGLEEKGKLATGKALIKYFCVPCKPTKVNGGRQRNLPEHDSEKWIEFKRYCINDVQAEREIHKRLHKYEIPTSERDNYILDQDINDRGIETDLSFALNAYNINVRSTKEILAEMQKLTGLDNPNSPTQLKNWLSQATGKEINTLAKDTLPDLIKESGVGLVSEVLELRQKSSKTSVKKYTSILNCTCEDGRAHGLFQFYGANRTGRWAGRLIQMQNLRQNHLLDLEGAREAVATNNYDLLSLIYDNIPDVLSQLIRTAFVARKGHTFAVADFSAIEARVIAWLADESWRLDVFNTHGKIYEASAAMMFNVPIEEVTKGSDYRAKGKVAELALGYQGATGALTAMGGENMGLSVTEMQSIVEKWRRANPAIVNLWKRIESSAKRALKTRKPYYFNKGRENQLIFDYNSEVLTIELPSGRKLFYQKPSFGINKFGSESIKYRGMDQITKQWTFVDTYGGKIVENCTQAIARDLLVFSMQNLDREGFKIVMHVHDEAVCEIPDKPQKENDLKDMCKIMSVNPPWAQSIPLAADGYITPFYKKD